MRPISTAQSFDEFQMLSMDEIPSRPPDAAIRANAEILKAGMESFAKLAQAAMAPAGLNLVISGSNPGVARPPEKISGQNGAILAAAALAGGIAAGTAGSEVPVSSEAPADEAPEAPQDPETPPPDQAAAENPPAPEASDEPQLPSEPMPEEDWAKYNEWKKNRQEGT